MNAGTEQETSNINNLHDLIPGIDSIIGVCCQRSGITNMTSGLPKIETSGDSQPRA